jgi:CubicO group peptidase (beta-lactamase class C family)
VSDHVSADLSNWQLPPVNRWGFWHVGEVVHTEPIPHGDGPVTQLPRADAGDIAEIEFDFQGRKMSFREMLDETYTDAVVVVHDGRLVFETYSEEGAADRTHLLMSVSKSLTSALVGALSDQGKLDTEALVTDVIPRLRGTSFDGATVQHLLDMRTGTIFDETDYENRDADVWIYDEVCAMSAKEHDNLPDSVFEFIATRENSRPHGGTFEYRSILTDLLGWVASEAGGASFGELFSEHIWSRLGCEFDAEVGVDPHGLAVVNGYICTTARDLARFGMMFLGLGEIDGRRVLSEEWVGRLLKPNPELHAAFAPSHEAKYTPDGFYHDCWWVKDPVAGVFAGEGINGQTVFVHGPSRTVISKFSSWPEGWHDDYFQPTQTGFYAVCEYLKGS